MTFINTREIVEKWAKDWDKEPTNAMHNLATRIMAAIAHDTEKVYILRKILEDYPKGQDDGSWIKRRDAAIKDAQ